MALAGFHCQLWESFVKEQKQPSQIEMCRCWPSTSKKNPKNLVLEAIYQFIDIAGSVSPVDGRRMGERCHFHRSYCGIH